MRKKVSISFVVAVLALVYLLLLVGFPALEQAILNIDFEPYWRMNEDGTLTLVETASCDSGSVTPGAMYFVPGIIGVLAIVAIWKLKREVKKDG